MPWSPSVFRRSSGLDAPPPPPSQKMNVDVIHDLAPLWAAVHSKPIAALGHSLRLSERSCRQEAAPDDVGVLGLHRDDRVDVALGHDEEMDGRLRVDVLEGQNRVVLVLDFGGSLAGHDAAEHTVLQRDPPGVPAIIRRRNTDLAKEQEWERVRSAS